MSDDARNLLEHYFPPVVLPNNRKAYFPATDKTLSEILALIAGHAIASNDSPVEISGHNSIYFLTANELSALLYQAMACTAIAINTLMMDD